MSPTPEDDLPWPDDAVEVARVIGAWGVKGWIRIQPFSSDPQAVFSTKRWWVQPAEPRPGALAAVRPRGASVGDGAPIVLPTLPALLKVVQAKLHGDGVVAAVQDVADRATAEALKGARIFVPRSSFPTASIGEYYWVDLIGLSVTNRQGEALGTVRELFDTGAHSVLRLVDEAPTANAGAGKPVERMIPFVAAYIDSVDLASRSIVADWGLDF